MKYSHTKYQTSLFRWIYNIPISAKIAYHKPEDTISNIIVNFKRILSPEIHNIETVQYNINLNYPISPLLPLLKILIRDLTRHRWRFWNSMRSLWLSTEIFDVQWMNISAYKFYCLNSKPKIFSFHEEIFNACYHKVQWKFPGWWLFEQYNNIICPHINNFAQRLVVDCTLMRVTSDLSH